MNNIHLGEIEKIFAYIIWNNEPITSGDLVKLAEKELNWKKSTTYTVLKKLCERGIFKNEKGIVSSIISCEEFYSIQSESFVDSTFNGSLPAFIAAFATRKKLSKSEVEEIREMIDSMKEE